MIRVMSLNIHHGRDKFGLNNLNRIVKIIQEHKVDMIGLQEVDRNVGRSNYEDQAKILAHKLDMFYAFGPNLKIKKGDYGNAILSKYPIEKDKNIIMAGFPESRGLLTGKIRIKEKKIHFLVTHLGLTKKERNNQVELILENIKSIGEKIVLVGDFNCREESVEIKELKEVLIDGVLKGSGRHQYTYNGMGIKSRIDYIFASEDLKILDYKVIYTPVSDHFPLMTTLEI